MRYITTLILTLAVMAVNAGELKKFPEQKLCQWFVETIEKDSVSPSGIDMILKKSDIASAETQVWQTWVKANGLVKEEKLPELKPLESGNAGVWHIPSDLEPNAVLNFVYGSKSGHQPAQDSKESPYPLFLYLHGSGPPDQEWAIGKQICGSFDDAPSAYFIPRIPNAGDYYRWWQKGKQWSWKKLLRQALASGDIDPERIYMFGISEGGYGSQRLASFYADYLAAAGPMAGGEPLKNAPAENCRNISFSLRTGEKDYGFYRDKLTRYTKAAFDSLASANKGDYNHWIELVPDCAHHIDYRPTTPWLRQFSRNPYPKRVSWEDFEMDGLHRTGFYNLAVIERPKDENPEARTRYEMKIKDNVVDVTVDMVDYQTIETDSRWGIALKFIRSYRPADNGIFRIYLNSHLVDMDKKVTVIVNGKKYFEGKLKPSLQNMAESCAEYGDSMRIYPASVTVNLSQ